MERVEQLRAWAVRLLGCARVDLAPASEDASFRRYFRLRVGETSVIAMDAPPEHEDCRPFIHVAHVLKQAGVNVPEILGQDLERGFLLLTDFGSRTYLDALCDSTANDLYRDALRSLVSIQLASRGGVLAPYDRAALEREMRLFPQWYVERHLGITLSASERETLEATFETVLACNLAEPRVYVHRDYHSRNLMVTEPNPGILDFQDALYGPLTYDLVSLLRDAYREWPEERVLDWTIRYWELARSAGLPVRSDFAEFYRDFEWMGVQRQLKVLGIFARLWHRDGKDRYLADIPLVARYLHRACRRYRELDALAHLLDRLAGRSTGAILTF